MTSSERHIKTLLRSAGTLRSRELVEAGITRSELSRMVVAGQLVRVARGLYAMPGFQSSENGALVAVAKRAPDVVFCLLTALRIHDLTTQAPFEVWIAIGNKSHPPRLAYPLLRTVHFSEAALTSGIETRRVDGVKIQVTSVAKTVADCFKYRNKIGIDVAVEALKDFTRTHRGGANALARFARICRVSRVMQPYLDSIA